MLERLQFCRCLAYLRQRVGGGGNQTGSGTGGSGDDVHPGGVLLDHGNGHGIERLDDGQQVGLFARRYSASVARYLPVR